MRNLLDCEANGPPIQCLVNEEGSDFTDYLNFFELAVYLSETKQISKADVNGLFQYYLNCLNRHDAVKNYLNNDDNGFEQLKRFLMSDYLFTYGTLKHGHAPDEIASAVTKLRPVGKGFVPGVLYDLGDYPGAVLLNPSSGSKDIRHGI